MHSFQGLCLAAVVLTCGHLLQDPPRSRALPRPGLLVHQASMLVVSPRALITWATRVNHEGAHTLDLLVVWKGSDGWHKQGARSGTGGGTGRWFEYTARSGELELTAKLDSIERIAEIQGRRLALRGANVILVDGVDVPGRLRIVNTVHVDPATPIGTDGQPLIDDVWKRSPEVVDFVRR